jgi:hypothetical protein
MLLLGNFGQQLDIHEVSRELDALRSKMRADGRFDQEVSDYLSKLAGENAELKLYLAALIQLLIAKNIVVPDELKTVVEKLDSTDGKANKRFDGDIVPH